MIVSTAPKTPPRLLARGALLALLAAAQACATDTRELDAGTGEADAGPRPIWVHEPGVPTREDLFAIWGRSAQDIFAVGWNGTILHYDGTSWIRETTTATVPLTDVHGLLRAGEAPAPGDPVFAVGWGGTVLSRGEDGTWSPLSVLDVMGTATATLGDDLFGVFVGSEDSALAVGDKGRVLGWDGSNWQRLRFFVPGEFSGLPIEPLGVLKGLWSENGSSYVITGSGGAAYRSTGGFQAFEALDTRVNEPLRGAWGVAGGPVFAVGLDGIILRFAGEWRRVTDDGARELPRAFYFDIDGLSTEDITVVGWRGVAVRRFGGGWAVEPTGTERDLRGVWVDRETGVAYAVGATGTILRRDVPVLEDLDAGVAD